MDDQDEITARLARVKRKLNQLMSAVLAVLGMAVGGIIYFFSESQCQPLLTCGTSSAAPGWSGARLKVSFDPG